jgi:hypothetical protein
MLFKTLSSARILQCFYNTFKALCLNTFKRFLNACETLFQNALFEPLSKRFLQCFFEMLFQNAMSIDFEMPFKTRGYNAF